jgi:hypothetical protein
VTVLGIDPGYEQSAWVLFDGRRIVEHAIEPNADLLRRLSSSWRVGEVSAVVIETIESYGMAVGRETFETVFWIGRFFDRALHRTIHPERMTRKAVKIHLCQSVRAQDTNIRCAIHDRFGGKEAAVGRKASQGPLFGIKSHEYAALAIALTWWDQLPHRKVSA